MDWIGSHKMDPWTTLRSHTWACRGRSTALSSKCGQCCVDSLVDEAEHRLVTQVEYDTAMAAVVQCRCELPADTMNTESHCPFAVVQFPGVYRYLLVSPASNIPPPFCPSPPQPSLLLFGRQNCTDVDLAPSTALITGQESLA